MYQMTSADKISANDSLKYKYIHKSISPYVKSIHLHVHAIINLSLTKCSDSYNCNMIHDRMFVMEARLYWVISYIDWPAVNDYGWLILRLIKSSTRNHIQYRYHTVRYAMVRPGSIMIVHHSTTLTLAVYLESSHQKITIVSLIHWLLQY